MDAFPESWTRSALERAFSQFNGSTKEIANTVVDEYLTGKLVVTVNMTGPPMQLQSEIEFQAAKAVKRRIKELSAA
jgi:hypothetical protein